MNCVILPKKKAKTTAPPNQNKNYNIFSCKAAPNHLRGRMFH